MRQARIRVLVATGAALGLMVLVLGSVVAAAKSAELSSPLPSGQPASPTLAGAGTRQLPPQPQPTRPGATTPEVGQAPALPPAQQQVITRPIPPPDVFTRSPQPVVTGTFQPPALPAWVQALLAGDQLQAQAGTISIVKSASTDLAANGSSVYNGEEINYSVTFTNNDTQPINITILDILPRDALNNPQIRDVQLTGGCNPAECQPQFIIDSSKSFTYSTPSGTPITVPVTFTSRISWAFTALPAGDSRTVSVKATVTCQPTGAQLRNRAFFLAGSGGGSSNDVVTVVEARTDQSGGPAMSIGATWCSNEAPSNNRVDISDIDADGDLDLGFASFTGASAFKNDGKGQFTRMPSFHLFQAEDARWIDLNNDNLQEFLVVGQFVFTNAAGPTGYTGFNYLYRLNTNGTAFQPPTIIYSDDGIQQIAPADYNNDGRMDLAAGILWDSGSADDCKLRLYTNTGSGYSNFTNAGNNPCVLYGAFDTSLTVYAVAWGDYNNDGRPDLAVGHGNRAIRVFTNTGVSPFLSLSNVVTVATTLASPNIARDLAWGDYDGDGFLDLAAAFQNGAIMVYRNLSGGGFGPGISIPTNVSIGAAVDWADFNGDGQEELVVAVSNTRPKIYGGGTSFPIAVTPLQPAVVKGTVFGVRGFDADNDGDPDLVVTNQNAESVLYTTSTPRLAPTLTPIDSFPASSVAWGDTNGDGYQELLLGASATQFGTHLYPNNGGATFGAAVNLLSGPGPQSLALADFDNDVAHDLDVAISTPDQNQVHRNTGPILLDWNVSSQNTNHSVAWADADDDGDLDLLVGTNGANVLYKNQGIQLDTTPAWQSNEMDNTRSVAWADYNNDFYPDFAVGNYGQPNRVYLNNKNNTFSLAWSSTVSNNTTAIAWGDWDGDGDLDLAVANEGQPNFVYANNNGTFTPVWDSGSGDTSPTTSLAWGDWDNDGDLDLAFGNDGQADRVYENLLKENGMPLLAWRWTSDQPARRTTGVAWGDKDGDGDLDLAVSQQGGGSNGIYLNTYIKPSHTSGSTAATMPLSNNPTYLRIRRPGNTPDAYFFSSSEILGGPTTPTLVIPFTVYDPDGTRANLPAGNTSGDDFISGKTIFEYSLDGGVNWRTATPASAFNNNFTTRLGVNYNFNWDAAADGAVGDNARFRITIVNYRGSLDSGLFKFPRNRTGLNQRASVRAVSPPFRVRALTCDWPADPSITILSAAPYDPGDSLDFVGTIASGSDAITFTWDFGDNITATGQVADHIFTQNGTYNVTLTVIGERCPVAKQVIAIKAVPIGTGVPDRLVYLPLVLKSSPAAGATNTTLTEAPAVTGPIFEAAAVAGAPTQVTGLTGSLQPDRGTTQLSWNQSSGADSILGYRVYRSPLGAMSFRLLAEISAGDTTYVDQTATCGQMYFVTAYNANGESLPSTSSYFSPPCR